jgi:hypothetical protein
MHFFKYRVTLLPLLLTLCLNLSAQDALQQSTDFLQQYAGKFGVTADVQWRVVDNFTDLSGSNYVRLVIYNCDNSISGRGRSSC